MIDVIIDIVNIIFIILGLISVLVLYIDLFRNKGEDDEATK